MRKWRNSTFLSLGRELTVLTQEQAVSLSRIGTTVIGFKVQPSVLPRAAMEEIAEVVDLGELFAYRARVRDDPGMRARSRRTILKSSSIAKNCLRSS